MGSRRGVGGSRRWVLTWQEAPCWGLPVWGAAQAPVARVLPCVETLMPLNPSCPLPSWPLCPSSPPIHPLLSLNPFLLQNWSWPATCTLGSLGTLASPWGSVTGGRVRRQGAPHPTLGPWKGRECPELEGLDWKSAQGALGPGGQGGSSGGPRGMWPFLALSSCPPPQVFKEVSPHFPGSCCRARPVAGPSHLAWVVRRVWRFQCES